MFLKKLFNCGCCSKKQPIHLTEEPKEEPKEEPLNNIEMAKKKEEDILLSIDVSLLDKVIIAEEDRVEGVMDERLRGCLSVSKADNLTEKYGFVDGIAYALFFMKT